MLTHAHKISSIYSCFTVHIRLKIDDNTDIKKISVRLLSFLRCHSGFSCPPQWPITSYFEGFLYQILLFSYLNSWERASIFPCQCWVLNKGTTGTIFVKSLVWRGPWLGNEPGTSCTRLSRRRYTDDNVLFKLHVTLLTFSFYNFNNLNHHVFKSAKFWKWKI